MSPVKNSAPVIGYKDDSREHRRRDLMSVRRIWGTVVRYGFALPLRVVLGATMVLNVGAFFGIAAAEKWANIVDSERLGPYVGFQGGFTPISSWTNFWLYLLAIALACTALLPPVVVATIKESTAKTPSAILRARMRAGDVIRTISDVASFALVAIALLVVFGLLVEPFAPWLRTTILLCLGVTIGADNMKYSTDGEKYGLAPYTPRLKAVARLSSDRRVSLEELKRQLACDPAE
jgi:fluoride ion exporter CrcB/FEX